jgi:hypothetical protein
VRPFVFRIRHLFPPREARRRKPAMVPDGVSLVANYKASRQLSFCVPSEHVLQK